MSLQHLHLSPEAITALYKDLLIIPENLETVTTPPRTAEKPERKFLGENNRRIAIIVNEPDNVFLAENNLEFLTKVLDACKLNVADVAIINKANLEIDQEFLKTEVNPLHVWLFGVDPIEIKLPLTFPQFKVQSYAGCQYLYAPPLASINEATNEGKSAKRKLWECLKSVFIG